MKRLLLLIAIFAWFTTVYSQKYSIKKNEEKPKKEKPLYNQWNPQKTKPYIVTDIITSEGLRYVNSSYRSGKTEEEKGVLFSIDGSDSEHVYLALMIKDSQSLMVEQGSPMLIKTKDNEMLKLICTTGSEDKLGSVYSLMGHIGTVYTIYPIYSIDRSIINSISKGLTKIRLEVNKNIYDLNFKEDNISKFLLDCYGLIMSTLAEERNFEDNF